MKKRAKDPRAADPMDRTVGANIRRIRQAKGVSQEKLGASIGVTFQQVQKIEKGLNRIAAGRLYKVSKALGTPVQEFFGE